MSCYAVIDTNVLVSALLTGNAHAATVQVVARVLAGEIIPVYSSAIMAEYHEVLGRAKFGFSPGPVNYLLSALARFGLMVEPSPSGVVLPDMKDLPFYEVALEKRADGAYLVTGNLKHFPQEPFIVTARQLLEILDTD
ncbi:MAG: putative toxin-antitoxin system toxin component, PIN family [Clostridia bacterium]|nr:putative toxin-antitoxin system toxin component, PIN family [Clostridia bacterium]